MDGRSSNPGVVYKKTRGSLRCRAIDLFRSFRLLVAAFSSRAYLEALDVVMASSHRTEVIFRRCDSDVSLSPGMAVPIPAKVRPFLSLSLYCHSRAVMFSFLSHSTSRYSSLSVNCQVVRISGTPAVQQPRTRHNTATRQSWSHLHVQEQLST